MNVPYILTTVDGKRHITIFIGGVPTPVDETHPSFDQLVDGIDTLSLTEIRDLLNNSRRIEKAIRSFGNIKVTEGQVLYKGEVVHNLLAERMLKMLDEGRDIRAWALFMENLLQNPAKHAVDELYLWLEQANMPITERGNFLAYKKVREDYTSYHRNPDGSNCHNDIGSFVSMQRNRVCDDRNKTCSQGLHFCSWSYLPSYMGHTGKVVIVEINPAHVVSIPSDYNNAKGRAEGYLVVGEIPLEKCEHAFQDFSFVRYSDSEYIYKDEEDEIDYSSIEDNWFDEYDDDEEDYDTAVDEAYNHGFRYGYDQAAVNVAYSLEEAADYYKMIWNSEGFDSSFQDGYSDGYFDAALDMQYEVAPEKSEPKDQEEKEVGYARLIAAYDYGFQCGRTDRRDWTWISPINFLAEYSDHFEDPLSFEEEEAMIRGYNNGGDF